MTDFVLLVVRGILVAVMLAGLAVTYLAAAKSAVGELPRTTRGDRLVAAYFYIVRAVVVVGVVLWLGWLTR